MFTKVEDALHWMEERRFNTKGIDVFQTYMNSLNNPQHDIPCIHIAGTNGKGSTLHYISQMLQSANYQVGTFTSPYLESHFDRIRINDQNIPDSTFLEIVNIHYQSWCDLQLNMFEIDFVIASLYFQKMKPDFVLYEVGLGGRTDATNVVSPMVSIITNIGMDHMEYLGETYEKIAKEKAGIIKECTPLITAEDKDICLQVFQTICNEKQSTLLKTNKANVHIDDHGLQFSYQMISVKLNNTPLYQENNLCCALEAILFLKNEDKITISTQQMQDGLSRSQWKGRFEIVHEQPLVIIDGAHNKEGIEALCASMKPYEDIHIIFSALKDKEHDIMLETLLKISDDITVCEFGFYRSSTCMELAKQYPVHRVKDYRIAIKDALQKKGTILITGSLYFISDVRKYILKQVE